MELNLSERAREDLSLIWLYTFENWSKEQADKYLGLIFDEIDYLSRQPLAGKDFGHVRKNYRYAKVKSHLIFYRYTKSKNRLDIIRVLHGSMDVDHML